MDSKLWRHQAARYEAEITYKQDGQKGIHRFLTRSHSLYESQRIARAAASEIRDRRCPVSSTAVYVSHVPTHIWIENSVYRYGYPSYSQHDPACTCGGYNAEFRHLPQCFMAVFEINRSLPGICAGVSRSSSGSEVISKWVNDWKCARTGASPEIIRRLLHAQEILDFLDITGVYFPHRYTALYEPP